MSFFWITDFILSFSCFTVFLKLIQQPNSHAKLAAVSVLLLSIASLIGTLKFAFNLQGSWPDLHNMMSRVFGVTGLYILAAAWLDFAGIIRVKLPRCWAHVADGLLIFLLANWLDLLANFQLVIGIVMNIFAFITAYFLLRKNRVREAFIVVIAASVFIVNGLVIGGAASPLFGSILRMDVFHLLFSAWVLTLSWSFRQPVLPSKIQSLQ